MSKNNSDSKVNIISEGTTKKGSVNTKPKTPRPQKPSPQRGSDSNKGKK